MPTILRLQTMFYLRPISCSHSFPRAFLSLFENLAVVWSIPIWWSSTLCALVVVQSLSSSPLPPSGYFSMCLTNYRLHQLSKLQKTFLITNRVLKFKLIWLPCGIFCFLSISVFWTILAFLLVLERAVFCNRSTNEGTGLTVCVPVVKKKECRACLELLVPCSRLQSLKCHVCMLFPGEMGKVGSDERELIAS